MRLRVADLVSRPVLTVPEASPLDAAVRDMEDAGVRHLVVVDAEGRAKGLLTDRVLLEATGGLPERIRELYQGTAQLRRCVADLDLAPVPVVDASSDALSALIIEAVLHGADALVTLTEGRPDGILSAVDLLRAAGVGCDLDGASVRPLMTPGLRTCSVQASLGEALETMRTYGIHHLAVCGQAGLVGMFSERDALRALGQGRGLDDPLEGHMSRSPHTVEADDPLAEAVGLLLKHRISALPVTEGNRLVGMISVADILDHLVGRD